MGGDENRNILRKTVTASAGNGAERLRKGKIRNKERWNEKIRKLFKER